MNQGVQNLKSLLIISQDQFGYQTSLYEFVKRLKNEFEISVVCRNENRKKIEIDKVKVRYLKSSNNKIINIINFRLEVYKLYFNYYDIVIFKYFSGCSLLHFIAKKPMKFCYVVTGAVFESRLKRFAFNALLCLEVRVFKHKIFISKLLAKKMKSNNYYYLPLGANQRNQIMRTFDRLSLIYIGTLDGRRIEDTITGLGLFYRKYGNIVHVDYKIIGEGKPKNIKKIKLAIDAYDLWNIVDLKGYIHRDDLEEFEKSSNVGVSYIPITPYYDCQPPTKTVEYLMSGMVVIATETKENKLLINQNNGTLIKDTPTSFCHGLEKIFLNRFSYDSTMIQYNSKDYSWENIVENLRNVLLGMHSY